MRDAEVPNWLKGLPLAPEFRPTDTEFADPIAYISKIEKAASAFGICKIIPPLPKPSKKYVLSNLNKSLSKCPELGEDINLAGFSSSSRTDSSKKADEGEVRAVFTTRHQELGQNAKTTKKAIHRPQPPIARKQVWQSGEIYTLEQFESKSKAFARSQLGMVKELSPLLIEALFWKAASEKPIYVEYANDVPGSGFGEPEGSFQYFHRRRRRRRWTFNRNSVGRCDRKKYQVDNISKNSQRKGTPAKSSPASASETSKASTSLPTVLPNQTSQFSRQNSSSAANEMEGTAGWKLSNSPWNLQVIARSPGSLTRFMPDDIPGVTSPMVYIGMLFSWFAWHVEDHELHSMNFLHTGSPKTWYSVPGDHAFAFEEVIRNQAYGGNIDRLAALTQLGEKTTLLSPEVIIESGIPCCRLIQYPGEFVVTFPRAYHVGFSHGFNCGEAANFGTSKWLKVAKEAAVRRAAMNHLPMLSHQQLLYLLTMSFISRVPRSLLPGARSSRLRDRLKEERELSVKKAFIEDIVRENNLLTFLVQRNSTYRVALWDLDSLQSSSKESGQCSSVATVSNTPREDICSENNNNQDLLSEMSLYMETVNGFYLDDDDLSCDLQLDSGTLACVACGILGFPFMCVVQPSEKASMHLVQERGALRPLSSCSPPVLGDMVEGFVSGLKDRMERNLFHHPDGVSTSAESIRTSVCSTEDLSMVTNVSQPQKDLPIPSEAKLDKGWSATRELLRPRIFCLEHAIQVEEMLQNRGGANVLVICHSDFKKIKAHAATIAEETSSAFGYNEIPLNNASQEDLNLIDLAIDDEKHDESGEDWTSKLSVNLRQCVQLRKSFPSKRVQHALALDGLFSDAASSTSTFNLKWPTRKSRSKRNLNLCIHPKRFACTQLENLVRMEPCTSIQMEKKKVLGANSGGSLNRKEGELIKYSRRSFKSKPGDSAAADKTSVHSEKQVRDEVSVADSVHGKNIFQSDLCNIGNARINSSVLGVLGSSEKSELQLDGGLLVAIGDNSEKSGPFAIADSLVAPTPGAENDKAHIEDNFLEQRGMDSKDSDLTMGISLEKHRDIKIGNSSKKHEKYCAGKSADALLSAPESSDLLQIQGENQVLKASDLINVTSVDSFEGQRLIRSGRDISREENSGLVDSAPSSSDEPLASLHGDQTLIEKNHMSRAEVVDCVVHREIYGHEEEEPVSSNVGPLNQSTSVSAEDSLEVSTNTSAAKEMHNGLEHCSSPNKRELENTGFAMKCPRSTARSRRKRRREEEPQIEVQSELNSFIRSPCEGLRPRAVKDAKRGGIDSNQMFEEKPVAKKVRRPSDSLLSGRDKKENRKWSHKCDLEGCRMSFQTKADLLMHKRNRCPYEGCGKKFSSHKYAVLHQRVHDDDRPLKCPWKDCTMSFKWAWARTEHLRVHTGERPYECKFEGCGLTFRFVSDYSRHRRKTGHYVSSPS